MEVLAPNGELAQFTAELRGCQKCALAKTRTQVVPGTGHPDADLMFVGEAPGYHEDQQGAPFVGQAGKLLDRLLGEIGLTRDQVFIANVLKCRPPGNRDPLPEEIEACEGHLFHQLDLIRPRVVCTLGNFATKLLSGQPYGITRVRGRPQRRRFGSLEVTLYPIYHPAAALYTPAMLETLRGDFARLPELLRADAPAPIGAAGAGTAPGNGTPATGFGWSPAGGARPGAPAGAGAGAPPEVGGEPEPEFAQLGLF